MSPDRCWVISDGKAGMESQCLGLAEALGMMPLVKRIVLRTPWKQLSPWLRLGLSHAVGPPGDPIAPPWPDLAIASGRPSIAPALAARRASRGRTFLVQIQDPVISLRHFDLVVAPRHDRLSGPNVMETRGALHRITPERLREAAARFAPRFAALPRPWVAVLIGGENAVYRLPPRLMAVITGRLAALARQGGGLLVTPSRRTGAANEAMLREGLAGLPAAVWDSTGENPYFAYLGLADAIIATGDSVNMVSEAASTGKPVHIIDLEGGSAKFRAFHEGLRADGITRPFTGTLESWSYTPLDDTVRVAAEVRRRLAARGVGSLAPAEAA